MNYFHQIHIGIHTLSQLDDFSDGTAVNVIDGCSTAYMGGFARDIGSIAFHGRTMGAMFSTISDIIEKWSTIIVTGKGLLTFFSNFSWNFLSNYFVKNILILLVIIQINLTTKKSHLFRVYASLIRFQCQTKSTSYKKMLISIKIALKSFEQ